MFLVLGVVSVDRIVWPSFGLGVAPAARESLASPVKSDVDEFLSLTVQRASARRRRARRVRPPT
jgi:hypothetical protein